MGKFALTVLALLWACFFTAAGTASDFDLKIGEILADYGIPGASVALIREGEIIMTRGFGSADVSGHIPVTPDTVFSGASITKTFTAMGIFILDGKGGFSVNDPVSQHAPDIFIDNPWDEAAPVRIIHLLEHSSGFNELHFNDYNLYDDPEAPLSKALDIGKNSRRLRWPSGTVRSYSSSGYALAGYILEAATDAQFEDYLQTEILDVLNMDSTSFRRTEQILSSMASGYGRDYKETPPVVSYSRPASSMYTTAPDLARFVQFLLRPDEMFSSPASMLAQNGSRIVAAMESAVTTPAVRAGLDIADGAGIGASEYGSYLWRGHGGADIGFSGAYAYCRELDAGYVFLTNYYDTDFVRGSRALQNHIRRYLIDGRERTPAADVPESAGTADTPAVVDGFYAWVDTPQRLTGWLDGLLNGYTVESNEDGLYLNEYMSDSRERLVPAGNGRYRFDGRMYSNVAFTEQEGGSLIVGDSLYRKKTKAVHILQTALLAAALLVMLSAVPVAVVRAALGRLKKDYSMLFHASGIAALFTGLALLGSQPMLEWGQPTWENRAFFFLSLWFAAAAVAGTVFFITGRISAWRSGIKNGVLGAYTALLSLATLGTAVFLSLKGIVGLRFWLY